MRAIILGLTVLMGCGSAAKFEGKAHESGSQAPTQAPAQPPAPGAQGVDKSGTSGAMAVVDAAALPVCDATSEGRLVYLKAETKFQTCSSGAWADISIKGADGAPGKDAASGGAFGIEQEYTCGPMTADLDSAADTETKGFFLTVVKFSSGDYFMSCMDRFSSTTFTYADSTNGTEIYAASSKGVHDGVIECLGFYAHADFTIAAPKATWTPNGAGSPQDVACTAKLL